MIPKKNLTESVLARAELYRRGLMFGSVPAFGTPDPMLPPGPDVSTPVTAQGAPQGDAPPAKPGVTNELVAGAVDNKTPLQSIVTP
jgi:hypothetical protein